MIRFVTFALLAATGVSLHRFAIPKVWDAVHLTASPLFERAPRLVHSCVRQGSCRTWFVPWPVLRHLDRLMPKPCRPIPYDTVDVVR